MVLRFVFSSIALFILSTAAWAQHDVLQRIAERRQVTVGYAEQAAPFSFRSSSGPAGYAVDLCGAVVERLKRDLRQPALAIRFVEVDQDEVARHLSAGSVDLLCAGVSDVPARRAIMSFSSPIFISSVKLMVRVDDRLPGATALKGRTVALLGRTTAEAAVNAYSQEQGLGLQVARVVSPEAALAQLRLRQADAWARDEILLLGAVAREPDAQRFAVLPEVLSTETIAIAMPRDVKLQKLVNDTLADLARSGQLQAVYDRWFVRGNSASPGGFKLPMTPELQAEFARLR